MSWGTIRSVGVFVLAMGLLASASPTLAQGRGRGQGQGQGKSKVKEPAARTAKPREAQPVFGSRDREMIRDYYANLPPGLAKRDGNLPPGLEKQLRRNGTLPPGLQKRLRPFPAALERRLGPLPRGYRRGIIDDHVLVYRTDNHVIYDLFRDAVR